jgi:hypothetical protein
MAPFLILISGARRALAAWQNMPATERARLQGTANRVRSLSAELAAPKAGRERDVVARELRDALTVLGAAAGSAAAGSSKSRTMRLGGRAAQAGYRRLRDRQEASAGPAQDDWATLSAELEARWGGERPNPSMLAFEVHLPSIGRTQRMVAQLDAFTAGAELLTIHTAVALAEQVDLVSAIRDWSHGTLGDLGLTEHASGADIVTLGIKLPIDLLTGRSSVVVPLVEQLASSADELERAFGDPDAPDRF